MKNRPCSVRAGRFNSILRSILTDIVRTLNDPKICQFVTITRVDITKDLCDAKVFFTTNPDNQKSTLEGFKRAKGFISCQVAKMLRARRVPRLTFHIDKVVEEEDAIFSLFNSL